MDYTRQDAIETVAAVLTVDRHNVLMDTDTLAEQIVARLESAAQPFDADHALADAADVVAPVAAPADVAPIDAPAVSDAGTKLPIAETGN